ncbi:MAG: ABC transporter ATP-binding protein [Steroidobacteraceae bacterium]
MSAFKITRLDFWHGARAVLRGIDLTVQSGSVTAVLGPNGAGKSTLLACLAGLLTPRSGAIALGDVDLHVMHSRERAQQIAFLPQTPEIAWPIDVATLVGLGRIPYSGIASEGEDRAAVERAMAMTSVSQWARRSVTELSGGERSRVLLARVFAGTSKWILADEPFTGLDPAHQFEAAELLRAFAADGGGVVLTIHDLSLAARIADRIIVLNEGRVAADGTPEVALEETVLRSVYGVETEWLVANRRRTPVIAIHGRYGS